MARAAYIMFCESGAVDQATNRVSLFNVVELIPVALRPAEGAEPGATHFGPLHPLRITVVWMRGEGDTPDVQFENQIIGVAPGGTELFQSPITSFAFSAWFQRLDAPAVVLNGFPTLGVYEVVARLRRAGSETWEWHQSFPFVVQEQATQLSTGG